MAVPPSGTESQRDWTQGKPLSLRRMEIEKIREGSQAKVGWVSLL
jgi:hypothetical protein